MFKILILSNDATVDDSSGPAVWGGPVTLNGNDTFTVAANLLIDNIVGGSGGLTLGGGVLALSQSNIYTGPTIINTGTLQLTNDNDGTTNGSIASSSSIEIVGGANLDVSLLTPASFTLYSGQTLTGGGDVLGSLVANSGSTIMPTGTLTITNALTLGGTAIMSVTGPPQFNGELATVGGSITYGGALIVTNTSGTLASGESFQLFHSGSGTYPGSFSSIQLPTLASGLTWNTNQLATTGTISIGGSAQVLSFNPSGITRTGTTVGISGSGGNPGGTYYVLSTTNIALPLNEWTPIETNTFDGSGDFNFNVSTTNAPHEYFEIEEQQ
jgi:autotransporter-associated beta strand protein